MATRSTMSERVSLKRVKNSLFGGCIGWPTEDLPGPTVPACAPRRRFAKGLSVHSGRRRERRIPAPETLSISRTGELAARPESWCSIVRTYGNGRHEMRVVLSTYRSRGDVEPTVGLAVQLGHSARRCGCARRRTYLCTRPSWSSSKFDTVAAAAEE
jgi:hypothetical protein